MLAHLPFVYDGVTGLSPARRPNGSHGHGPAGVAPFGGGRGTGLLRPGPVGRARSSRGWRAPPRRPWSATEDEDSLVARLFPAGCIRTAPPDPHGVCHDWTFGGTQYSDGRSVASLLEGFHRVERPRAGDVIVYYGPSGEAVHSGIVRAVGSGGLVVIESKWGYQGRYLHLTAIARFPSKFIYYRRAGAVGPTAGLRGWGRRRLP